MTLEQDVTNKRLRANGAGVNVSFDLKGFDYVLDEISVGGRDGDNVSVTFADSNPPVVVAVAAVAAGGLAPAAANGAVELLRADLMTVGKGGITNVTIPIKTGRVSIDFTGRVNVKGAKGLWDVNSINVGVDDTADMFIQDRAIVDTRNIAIGFRAGSIGSIEVSDATLLHSGSSGVSVGIAGTGTLAVKNKGLVDVKSLGIGNGFTTGDGRVTVESLGELRVDGQLDVGLANPYILPGGTGRLTVDGGSVHVEELVGVGRTKVSAKGVSTSAAATFTPAAIY